jgi:hypothetical protein
MGFPPPQFGVPLSEDQINPELPFYPIYGVTPQNKYIPFQVDAAGALATNATFVGSITVADVTIRGVDPADSFSPHDVSVVNWGIDGYALRTSLFYQDNVLLIHPNGSIDTNIISGGNSLSVNPNGSINVNVVGSSVGIPNNIYAENLAVPPSSTTTLFTYVVPAGVTFNINGLIGWGTYDGEWLITVNGANKGGGWSSPSFRTIELDYLSIPIVAVAGDTVAVTITNYAHSSQTFRMNLLTESVI